MSENCRRQKRCHIVGIYIFSPYVFTREFKFFRLPKSIPIPSTSCACTVLAKSQMISVWEAATQVQAIFVVVGIERKTYINPMFNNFFR